MDVKSVVNASVLENRKLADGIYQLEAAAPDLGFGAVPGQFVNVYPVGRHTLLPRPISICTAEKDTLKLVYGVVGEGTAEFSGYRPGDVIRVSTPLGHGFDLDDTRSPAILVGGGIGVPPLAGLARALSQRGVRCTAVLGFRDEPFLAELFRSFGAETLIATDSGRFGHKGSVIDLLRHDGIDSGRFYACGPRIMLKSLNYYCMAIGAPLQVSMEERMGCGFGACVGCVCRVRDPKAEDRQALYRKVCTDGPVFDGKDVVWDE